MLVALIKVLSATRNLAGARCPPIRSLKPVQFADEKVAMSAEFVPPSKELYRVVGIAADESRTVILSGMELNEAKAARQAQVYDRKYAWIVVEPETG
jgi:hypothetical protein